MFDQQVPGRHPCLQTHADHMLANGKDPVWKAKALGADWPGELGVLIAATGGLARSQGHYQEATPLGLSLSEGACALFSAVGESLCRDLGLAAAPVWRLWGVRASISHMGKDRFLQIPFCLMCSSRKSICSGWGD